MISSMLNNRAPASPVLYLAFNAAYVITGGCFIVYVCHSTKISNDFFDIFRNFTFMKSRNGHTIVKAKHKVRKLNAVKESPETVIMRLVRNGKLAGAGQRAMKSSLQKGLAVTILEDGKIYRVYPNGARKLIKSISSPKRKSMTGKVRIA